MTVQASPVFWKFLFEKHANRTIEVSKPYDNSKYEATTLVRMAFKAFEMNYPFTFGSLDPTAGTIALSQKVKFDKMTEWTNSPFHTYQLKRVLTYYRIVKKHKQVKCGKCGRKNANLSCSNKMCKKCCLDEGPLSCKARKKVVP